MSKQLLLTRFGQLTGNWVFVGVMMFLAGASLTYWIVESNQPDWYVPALGLALSFGYGLFVAIQTVRQTFKLIAQIVSDQ